MTFFVQILSDLLAKAIENPSRAIPELRADGVDLSNSRPVASFHE
jgi:hypothetical protein